MLICNWQDLSKDFEQLREAIHAGERASSPFPLVGTPLSAALQRKCSEIYVREKFPENPLLPKFNTRYEHERIRLGYFSADFCNHATAYLMAEFFEQHDKSQFELIAFSIGPIQKDAMRIRLEKAFDRFIEVGTLSDKDISLLARGLEIDIAIDLKGFTQGSRTGIFAMRAAPIQISYMGYPGTMGAEYIDYLVADATVVPQDQRKHYAENIVHLPDTYWVTDSTIPLPEQSFSRVEFGLPADGFVFCCFNNNYKINPAIFDIWMRLLDRVDGSVLWLLEDNASAAKNLKVEAQARGVSPSRLVFAERLEVSEHLARHHLADLFLDTIPYNAHTTATDALWAGLPVLTSTGETFAGRVAASVLNAIGLPELITHDLAAYESLALELATKPKKINSLKEKLAANRLTHPLFNTARFTKHFESAYRAMLDRHLAGLKPAHITVAPEGH